jgi:mannan endo-1,4-beta-mannosidase
VSKTTGYIIQHAEIAKQLKKPLVIEEFGLPRDNHSFNIKSSTNLRDNYYRVLFAICNESRMGNGVIAGLQFLGLQRQRQGGNQRQLLVECGRRLYYRSATGRAGA